MAIPNGKIMIFKRSTVTELTFIWLKNLKFIKHKKIKLFFNSKCSLCSFWDCAEGGGCTPLPYTCTAELLKAKIREFDRSPLPALYWPCVGTVVQGLSGK
jgi:hypothetical protein